MRAPSPPPPAPRPSFWSWLKGLFSRPEETTRERVLGAQEQRVLAEFCRVYGLPFKDLTLLKLALTHRSYLSVTGQGPRESNERLEFLGDSVLGLVTSEFLYRRHPDEHEGQLTKTKSLLVSKAILSRRALRIGLGRFVLMSHSEVESGGRQRLSILADAFESVIGAVYLDQGFEPAREFIHRHLLAESDAITADKRHTNYKSHLQEYVQNAFRTHPVYRIRSEYGPDHSKHFMVEVMVGKRTLGEGRGHNKKEAEQAAARDALEKVERLRRKVRDDEDRAADRPQEDDEDVRADAPRREPPARRESGPARRGGAERADAEFEPAEPAGPVHDDDEEEGGEVAERGRRRRRSRRGGRSRHGTRGLAPEGTSGAETDAEGPERMAPVRGVRARPERAVTGEDLETPRTDLALEPDSQGPPDERDEAFGVAEEPSLAEAAAERSPLVQWEEGVPEREPAAKATNAAPARAMSFGRGRRRDAAAGGTGGETHPRGGSPAVPAAAAEAEERQVDVFASPATPVSSAAPGEPASAGTAGSAPGAHAPVVDVTADEGVEGETDREREARIDEMERALESFGRRRTPDYGRRGRRR